MHSNYLPSIPEPGWRVYYPEPSESMLRLPREIAQNTVIIKGAGVGPSNGYPCTEHPLGGNRGGWNELTHRHQELARITGSVVLAYDRLGSGNIPNDPGHRFWRRQLLDDHNRNQLYAARADMLADRAKMIAGQWRENTRTDIIFVDHSASTIEGPSMAAALQGRDDVQVRGCVIMEPQIFSRPSFMHGLWEFIQYQRHKKAYTHLNDVHQANEAFDPHHPCPRDPAQREASLRRLLIQDIVRLGQPLSQGAAWHVIRHLLLTTSTPVVMALASHGHNGNEAQNAMLLEGMYLAAMENPERGSHNTFATIIRGTHGVPDRQSIPANLIRHLLGLPTFPGNCFDFYDPAATKPLIPR